jgi:hypothetical protein
MSVPDYTDSRLAALLDPCETGGTGATCEKGAIRSSKFEAPKTSNLELSPVSLVPPVSRLSLGLPQRRIDL